MKALGPFSRSDHRTSRGRDGEVRRRPPHRSAVVQPWIRSDPRRERRAHDLPTSSVRRGGGRRPQTRHRWARRPHRSCLRDVGPCNEHRPRSGLHDRSGERVRRRSRAALCDRGRAVVRRARWRAGHRGVGARRDDLPPRRPVQPVPARAVGSSGQLASRWASCSRRVHRARRNRWESGARRGGASIDPEPSQARLRDGHSSGPAAVVR